MNKNLITLSIVAAFSVTACGGSGANHVVPSVVSETTVNVNVQKGGSNVEATSSIFAKSDAEITAHNEALKKSYNSHLKYEANQAVQATDGDGSLVMLMEQGAKAKHNVHSLMFNTTTNQKISAYDHEPTNHGTDMAEVVHIQAPKTKMVVQDYNKGQNGVMATTLGALVNMPEARQMVNASNKAAIINGSFEIAGVHDPKKAEFYYKTYASTIRNALDANNAGLIIATGNSENKNPSISAQVGLFHGLDSHMLAVTAHKNGKQELNQCGVTAHYCVAAPHLTKGSNPHAGTSGATAYVSGVASLVASNYDWMTGKQVLDVIKTTTDKKSDTSRYGLGIVNKNRAMNGYGAFNNTTILTVDGKKDTYYFSNDIGGSGSLLKRGNKTLVLNGNNSYSGDTVIDGGKLVVNGHNQSDMLVTRNAALAVGDNTKGISTGSITVNAGGTLESTTLANVRVKGDLTLKSASTVKKVVGSTINVDGKANLNGTLNLTGVADKYVTRKGSKETLIHTEQGVNGKFTNTVIGNTLLGSKVEYDNHNVSAIISRNTIGEALSMQTSNVVAKSVSHDTDTMEKVLTKVDAKLDENQTLKDNEKTLVAATTNNVLNSVVKHGVGSHIRMQDVISSSHTQRANAIVDKVQANETMWANYINHNPKTDVKGIQTDGKENGVEIGFSHKIDKNQSVGINTQYSQMKWFESIDNVGKSVRSKTYGVDAVYNLATSNGYNLFTMLGAAHSKVDGGKGLTYRAGVGANKVFFWQNLALIPSVSVNFSQSQFKNIAVSDVTELKKAKNTKATANVGVKTVFPMAKDVTGFASLGISQDIYNKTKVNVNMIDVNNKYTVKNNKAFRSYGNLGVNFQVNKDMNVNAVIGWEKGNKTENKTVGLGLNYKF